MEFDRSYDKTSREEHDFRNIERNEPQATCKQTSDGNSTFVIGNPMNKVHMGKNKSLVSSASTKIDLKSNCPFLWCVKVLDTALLRR